MANEIYDSTWWGNTIQTASSIGTSTEMIQGQFNLTKIGDEEVTNGDFATDSDWIKETGWTISNNKANANNTSAQLFTQNKNLVSGKTYAVRFEANVTSGDFIFGFYAASTGTTRNVDVTWQSNSSNTVYYLTPTTDILRIGFQSGGLGFIGSIDNVSVKEVRATTVEASKCLADAIHRIGIQDIQN